MKTVIETETGEGDSYWDTRDTGRIAKVSKNPEKMSIMSQKQCLTNFSKNVQIFGNLAKEMSRINFGPNKNVRGKSGNQPTCNQEK